MISLLAKWRKLSAADRRLFFEAIYWVAVMRIGLVLLPYRLLRRLAGDHAGETTAPSMATDVERLAWAIVAAARRIPKASCLPQALAAQAMLSRRRVPSILRIGVAGRGAGDKIRAHAWVECRGEVLIGKLADLEQYSVLASPTAR